MPESDTDLAGVPQETNWCVWRTDDAGNTFLVRDELTRAEAERLVAEFEARGHKQTYFAEKQHNRG